MFSKGFSLGIINSKRCVENSERSVMVFILKKGLCPFLLIFFRYLEAELFTKQQISDWSKFQTLADDKISVTEKLKYVLGMVENILGKWNMLVSSIFSLSQNVFKKLLLQGR